MNSLETRREFRANALKNSTITDPYIKKLLGAKDGGSFIKSDTDVLLGLISMHKGTALSSSKGPGTAVAKEILGVILEAFFSSAFDSLFGVKRKQIQEMVDASIDETTWEILSLKIDEINIKLHVLYQELELEQWDLARNTFLFLTEYFVGLEVTFKVTGRGKDYYFTPLFSTMVNLIISFRKMAILDPVSFQLHENEVIKEKILLKNMIIDTGAAQYMEDYYDQYFQELTDDMDIDLGVHSNNALQAKAYGQYKDGATEYSYFAKNGLERGYTKFWRDLAANPEEYHPIFISLPLDGYFGGFDTCAHPATIPPIFDRVRDLFKETLNRGKKGHVAIVDLFHDTTYSEYNTPCGSSFYYAEKDGDSEYSDEYSDRVIAGDNIKRERLLLSENNPIKQMTINNSTYSSTADHNINSLQIKSKEGDAIAAGRDHQESPGEVVYHRVVEMDEMFCIQGMVLYSSNYMGENSSGLSFVIGIDNDYLKNQTIESFSAIAKSIND